MDRSQALQLRLPQSDIKVDIDYYDAGEKSKLLAYPTAAAITDIVTNGVVIPTAEFLTYYLFHRLRPQFAGWRNYTELAGHIDVALAHVADWLEFDGTSISTPNAVGAQDKDITEYVGESIGLAVVGRIHGLHAADWSPIRIHGGRGGFPTFDYQIGSDGSRIVQLETKGSSLVDNRSKSASISNHHANIAAKKQRIAADVLERRYPYPADIRYGTITVIGSTGRGAVQCWLVDPPADPGRQNAHEFRLLQRQRFIGEWISFLSPRSRIAVALQNRVADLEAISNPFALNRTPLRTGTGKDFAWAVSMPSGHSSFFGSRSRVVGRSVGGVTVQLANGAFFFAGIDEQLLQLASDQDFDKMLTYSGASNSFDRTVECVFSRSHFEQIRLPASFRGVVTKRAGYFSVNVSGRLHSSSAGLVFGVLPLG